MTEPTTTAEPYAEALVTAEAQAQDVIADNLTALIFTLWTAFVAESAFYAGEAVAEFGRRVATYVIAAQRQAGLITEAHLREQMRDMGLVLPPSSVLDLPADLRLGAATDDVYQRPIRQVRYLESTGVPLAEAVQTATERLEKTALRDLGLARATSAQQLMYSLPDDTPVGPVRGYRRIIHPELGAVCGLCIAASDRIYKKRDLLPLHPACRCTVIPVIGVQDPGGTLNAEDLARIYAAAGGTTSTEALRQTRFSIKENGELGDVLVAVGEQRTTAEQALDRLSDRAKQMRREQLARQIEELRPRAERSQWHADRLEQLQDLLRSA